MKALTLLMLSLLSLNLWAGPGQLPSDPRHCGNRETCHKSAWFSAGTYYARGFGRSCDEAMRNSEELFLQSFGNMSCGLINGPHSWSCYRGQHQTYISWHECSPSSGGQSSSQSRCANVGGVLVCN